MRYSGYGVEDVRGQTDARRRVRGGSRGLDTERAGQTSTTTARDGNLSLPEGLTEKEAAFFLGIFARLKEKRFGRVEVTVREGHVTGVELVEKVDRNLFQFLGS